MRPFAPLAALPGKANSLPPHALLVILPDFPAIAFGYAMRRDFRAVRP